MLVQLRFRFSCINQLLYMPYMQDDDDDDWFPLDLYEAFEELRKRNIFNVDDMYTIADVWGWTWERELKSRPLRRWSQEWEVDMAMKVMSKASFYNSRSLTFMRDWL